MEERQLQIRVGMFVVLALVVLGILIFIHSEGWQSRYVLLLKTDTAPGVQQSTPIRKNGILIGRVGSIQSGPPGGKDEELVLLKLLIDHDKHVYENDIVVIGTDSILGDSVLEIVPPEGNIERGRQLGNLEHINFVSVKRNPLEIVDVAINLESKISEALDTVKAAGSSVKDAGDGIRELTNQVNSALGNPDSDFKQLLAGFKETNVKAQLALDNFRSISESLLDVMDEDERNKLKAAFTQMPQMVTEVINAAASTRQTIESFRDVSSKVNKNLDNLEEFTGVLRDSGPEIIAKINGNLSNIDELMNKIKTFGDQITDAKSGKGTLGKLINDPSLYDNANETVEHVKELIVKLEPMINDLRMFSDALARNPGELGLSGVIRRKSWESGFKGNTQGRANVERRLDANTP